jgi:hypothetical protein
MSTFLVPELRSERLAACCRSNVPHQTGGAGVPPGFASLAARIAGESFGYARLRVRRIATFLGRADAVAVPGALASVRTPEEPRRPLGQPPGGV